MPRCINCKQKFEPKRFLQKHCEFEECKIAESKYQQEKLWTFGNKEKTLKPPKIHSCKGLGIAKGHGCGSTQKNRIHGLGIDCKCYSTWLLNTPEGSEKLKRITFSVTAPRKELEKAFDNKKNRTKLNTLLINVRNVCHEYVRLRDKGKPCISCGDQWKDDHQCGHFYKSELYSNLRFEEKNLASQCKTCNLRKEGNESGYRSGIIQRYGIEHLNYLDEKAKAYKKNDYHWDREELEEIRKYYQEKLKNLKNES